MSLLAVFHSLPILFVSLCLCLSLYFQAEAHLCAYEALRTRCLSVLLSAALQHMRHTEDLLVSRLREKQQRHKEQQQEQQQQGHEGEGGGHLQDGLDLSILHVQFDVLMAATRPVIQILREKQALGVSDAYLRFVSYQLAT